MQNELKNEIISLVEQLKKLKKAYLANCIEENWQKTCFEYSIKLNEYSPDHPIEPELIEAFKKELARLEYTPEVSKKIITSLEKRRILQTAPHIVPALGPRMLCTDWLSSLGVSETDFYIVGMFSGIPFSNNHHSGRISSKNGETNLVPSVMQDALVYKSKIPEKLLLEINNLPENLKNTLPHPTQNGSYTKWALQSCENIQKKILDKKNLVYLDINEVISHYLPLVLENPSHILHKIFFDEKVRKEFTENFPDEIFFYAPAKKGKYEIVENLFISDNKLKNKNKEMELTSPKILTEEIKKGNLCPSLFLVFTTIAFINRFKCFGSFAQVEYLPEYQKKLAGLDFMKDLKIEKIPTANMTLGAFDDEQNLYPADLIAESRKLMVDKNYLFGKLIVRMNERLLETKRKIPGNKNGNQKK